MELLETQDPERRKLIETSDRHKKELEKEVTALGQKTERMLTNALIIGGSLALTYVLISSLSKGRKKKKRNRVLKEQQDDAALEAAEEDDSPSMLGEIGSKILSQAAVLLLDVAKDKLLEYLESRKKADENS